MRKSFVLPPALGDAVCKVAERLVGVRCDIILIAYPEGEHDSPSIVTSLQPDVMEAVIVEYGRQFEEGLSGKRSLLHGFIPDA